MEAKAIQATRSKLNELAISHNKLTTLVAVLLTEIQGLKDDMDKIKEMLDGVEVVSSGEEEKPTSRADSRAAAAPPAPSRSLPPPPQQPIQAVKSSSASSSRSRGARNSSLSELHADDIIKQLTMNAD